MLYYPQWFIDELVNEYDKENARLNGLKYDKKYLFECKKCGNLYEQSINNHIVKLSGERKQGCPICAKDSRKKNWSETCSKRRTYPQWFIDELVNEEDKEKAKNGKLSSCCIVEFKCDKGHLFTRSVNNHINLSNGKRKQNCPFCSSKNRVRFKGNLFNYPKWFIDELVNEEDKERARNKQLSSSLNVKFTCTYCGRIYKQNIRDHIKLSTGERKQGCPYCRKIKLNSLLSDHRSYLNSIRVYPQWFIDELVNEEDKEKARNGSLRTSETSLFKCSNGHIYKQIVGNHIKLSTGERKQCCPYCNNSRSKVELEIEEYVKSLGYNTEHKRFRDSNNKLFEIDIFIPERNVGIEYNGSYYHSIRNCRIDENYHYNKFNECRKNSILLITIFDLEWNQKEGIIKQYIKDILEGDENELSYNKEGYMDNNYPSWRYYKTRSDVISNSYVYDCSNIVYMCGYTKL